MATYCIADLHGRHDLFKELLTKIQFNHQSDTLYLLGDAIDHEYGGVQIIRYMMQHTTSCIFIRGNHEDYFLQCSPILDEIMSKPVLRTAVVEIGKHPSIFTKLFDLYSSQMTFSEFLFSKNVYLWSLEGNAEQRKVLIDALKVFANEFSGDQRELRVFFHSLNKTYKTRKLIEELVTIDVEEYECIKEYLRKSPKEVSLSINEQFFKITHNIRHVQNVYYPPKALLPQIDTKNIVYVYGHDPVPHLHRQIVEHKGFDFDFRKVFSYVDENNNYWYNLDLGSNPGVALRLEDLNEFYIGIPTHKNEMELWSVPQDVTEIPKCHFQPYVKPISIAGRSFKRVTKNRYIFVTYKNDCYEYLIAVDKTKSIIYYTLK